MKIQGEPAAHRVTLTYILNKIVVKSDKMSSDACFKEAIVMYTLKPGLGQPGVATRI
jgi:hypothetical protein